MSLGFDFGNGVGLTPTGELLIGVPHYALPDPPICTILFNSSGQAVVCYPVPLFDSSPKQVFAPQPIAPVSLPANLTIKVIESDFGNKTAAHSSGKNGIVTITALGILLLTPCVTLQTTRFFRKLGYSQNKSLSLGISAGALTSIVFGGLGIWIFKKST